VSCIKKFIIEVYLLVLLKDPWDLDALFEKLKLIFFWATLARQFLH